MTDRARELLERIVGDINLYRDMSYEMIQEIRAYLAEPEVKREKLSDAEIMAALSVDAIDGFQHGFWEGVRFCEKHHGIGGGDE